VLAAKDFTAIFRAIFHFANSELFLSTKSDRFNGKKDSPDTWSGQGWAADLIDDDEVIEKILRHLKLWPEHAESARLSCAPPSGNSERNVERYFDDPFPEYPVTTLSRGTGLAWRHRTRHGLR
jgi:hypothetical protein